MPVPQSSQSTFVASNSTKREMQDAFVASMAERVRDLGSKRGFNAASLGEAIGIPSSSSSNYWSGKRAWPVDAIPQLADALSTNVDYLLRGVVGGATVLRDASDADFVEVPEYDLRHMTDHGLGEPISSTIFRRDWLFGTLSDSSDLWVAKMLAPNPQLQLPAGTPLFCKDQKPGEPMIEGVHYFFRVNGGIVLAKFTFRGAGLYSGEIVATPIDMDREEDQHFVIAKVLGTVARPL